MNHSPWSMHHGHGNDWKPNCVWSSILFTAFLSRRSNFFLIALFCKIWIWETFLIWGFEFFEYSKCNLSIRLSISVFKFSPSYWGFLRSFCYKKDKGDFIIQCNESLPTIIFFSRLYKSTDCWPLSDLSFNFSSSMAPSIFCFALVT